MSSGRAETRRRLLESARKLLLEVGVNVRLEDIAREAGVSRQTVYLHFGSRNGLLVELFAYLDSKLGSDDVADWVRAAPDAISALDSLVQRRSQYIPEIYPAARPLIAARHADPGAEATYQDRQNARRAEYRLVAERLDSEGVLAPDLTVDEAAELTRVVLSIATWELMAIENGWSSERYARTVQRLLHKSLLRG